MHGYHPDEPLKRRGVTLVELTVGIAIAGVIGLVCAGLFKAGIKSYNYSYRQTRVIYSARKALAGDGPKLGMVWAVQSAASVDDISVSSLTVTPSGDYSTTYFVAYGGLYTSRLATRTLLADSVSGMTAAYYNMDAAGHIMVSTSASAAAFIITQITLKGALASDKTYNFISGAQVRNKQ